jgi:probable rRNA maturation factor
MKSLNSYYRGVHNITDVLSFPQQKNIKKRGRSPVMITMNANTNNEWNHVLGDLVICVPRAVSQAKTAHVTLYEELLRLLVHGLLHLLGYNHEKNTYQKRKMRNKERELLIAHKIVKRLA